VAPVAGCGTASSGWWCIGSVPRPLKGHPTKPGVSHTSLTERASTTKRLDKMPKRSVGRWYGDV